MEASAPPLLEFRNVSKHFGGVQALRDVSLAIRKGEVHAVLGQNGAGKSTLIKVLAGAVHADAGDVRKNGQAIDVGSPAAAMREGVTVVHQELTLLPDLTVWENVAAIRTVRLPLGVVDRRRTRRKVTAALGLLGLRVDLGARVGDLSLAQQQLVEIARALYLGGEILVLDEPNSALSGPETEVLLRTVRSLAESGTTVMLVSHRLEEVFSVADRVTVLRDGRSQGTWEIAQTDIPFVIRAMVGDVQEPPAPAERLETDDRVALELRDLRVGAVGPISLHVRRGEILGLAGLEGSGVDTVLRAAGGVLHTRARVEVEGRTVVLRRPGDAIARGIVYVPPDRKTEGLWLDRSIADNLMAGRLDLITTLRVLRPGRARRLARRWIERLGIRVGSPRVEAGALSGGNQQRVLLGRSLVMEPKVLLLSDPTRGVDVQAKAEIHGLLRELAAGGLAVCLSSSELKEVLELADRIVCLRRGRVAAEGPADAFNEDRLLELAGASG
jgi:rhamnose transport system ATP-binding protein